MAIDLEQFHQVFFEESYEGLDIMESSLMELDPSSIDSETINTIFRSAHSIKGGSATFGFSSIAEFTHVLETLLDQARSGERGLSHDNINLLLQSVDCMREMLGLLNDGQDGRLDTADNLRKKFEAILSTEAGSEENRGQASEAMDNEKLPLLVDGGTESKIKQNWSIDFRPHPSLFLSGNDPMRHIQALNALGELSIDCRHSALPPFPQFDPESSYLAWEIKLCSAASKEEIEEVFEWIDDDCDLVIESTSSAAQMDQTQQGSKWNIEFIPGINILRTGNEPARLLRALAELGSLNVQVNTQRIPDLISLDAESCYLNWTIQLDSLHAKESDIREVFEWVEDDSEINIQEEQSAEPSETIVPSLKVSKQESENHPPVSKKINTKSSASKKVAAEASSIRVGIDKVDNLINMVGELVITQSMLGELGTQHELEHVPKLMEGLSQLEQNTRELQESVMKIRMLPISFAFSRFPRMVRDLGQTLGKSIQLEMRGENTELDKTVMEKIGDPLVHLVRNAVDHGIETPDERAALGKEPSGNVLLNAFHQSGNVVIEIVDDGKGLSRENILNKAIEKGLVSASEASSMSDDAVFEMIFQPGFSTAQQVSDVSGRGVGMDVVKRNIQALNGVIEISSKLNQGSKITIKLPLTLAILDGQLVRVGANTYVFPLVSIVESMQCNEDLINRVAGGCKVFKLRDDYVPIIELYKSFSVTPISTKLDESLLVVVESDGEKVGVVVDELLGQQQVVIKSLEKNYRRVEGVSGATILGDGTVALILDIPGILRLSERQIGVSSRNLGNIINQFTSESADSGVPLRSVS